MEKYQQDSHSDSAKFRHDRRSVNSAVGKFLSTLVAIVIGLVSQFGLYTTAEAQSRTCQRLEIQIASLSRGGKKRNRKSYKKYTRAVLAQEVEINRAKQMQREEKCRGLFAGFVRAPACKSLNTNLNRMQSNLKKLKSKRASLAKFSVPTKSQKRKLQRALIRNKCSNTRQATLRKRSNRGRRTILEQIFGARGERNRELRYSASGSVVGPKFYSRTRRGTFRTLCVRTCDGYYFPISYSTPQQMFGRDEEACSNMCPGSQTELFYHAAGEEDAEQMISYVTDRPYTDLPSAFSYREKVNPGCTCTASNRQLNFSTLAGETDAEREERLEQEKAKRIAIPLLKPDFGEDPETLANRSGKFSINSFAALRQSGSVTASAMVSQSKKNIRIVGESFFPNQ